jgi:putative membrane protein
MSAAKGKVQGELPTKPDAKDQAAMREAEGLSGAKFDQAYMRNQIQDHVKTVELFQREAKDGKDEELRKLAEQTLPMLQDHLKMARQTGSEVGVRG